MLTFEEWQKQGEYTMSIGDHKLIQDEALRFTFGYVYPGAFFIEFKPEFMNTCKDIWFYHVMDGDFYGSSRFYGDLEEPLYQLYVAEMNDQEWVETPMMYIVFDGDHWQYTQADQLAKPFDKADLHMIRDLEIGQVYHKSGTDIIVVRTLIN